MTEKETVTAREDQPQLGTCDNEPEVLHVYNSRNVLCRNWRPEDQPRPTPEAKTCSCGDPRCNYDFHFKNLKRIGEAQGEAPRNLDHELADTCGPFNFHPDLKEWPPKAGSASKPVEAGAHPSQDAPSTAFAFFAAEYPHDLEVDDATLTKVFHFAEAYAAHSAGARSTPSLQYEFSSPPLTEEEIAHCRKIAASIPLVEHPQTYPDSAFALFDDLTILLYDEGGAWRVQAELADGTKAIISVNNRMTGEQARAQIRGIALQLLGHFLKATDREGA